MIPAARRSARTTVLHLDTERGWRGGERQTLWLACALDTTRYRAIVAARPAEPLAARAAAAGLPVVGLAPVSELDPRAAWRLHKIIRRESVDILHAHTAHAVALAALATLGTSVPVVATRRVDFPLGAHFGTRWKYGRVDALIAISQAVADVLVGSGVARTRIEIIPSGIDLTRCIEPASPATLATLGVVQGAPLVVQVAQLVGHKDPVTFVEAVARARHRVSDLQALLVGDGPLRGAVVDAVRRAGVGDVLHLTGYRDDADRLLAASDVAALSSREEGLGTVLLDALALGKPVAATRAGGIPEIIANRAYGLTVPVGDGRALGDAIADLMTAVRTDSTRRALATAARARAAEFAIERTAERTAVVYERVLSTSRERSGRAGVPAQQSGAQASPDRR